MWIKTAKGREELRPGQRTLGQRERAVLLLVDGQQPDSTVEALFGGQGQQLIQRLLDGGYVERSPDSKGAGKPALVRQPSADTPSSNPSSGAQAHGKSHGDAFSGPRSLASARMFLFDLSERMFARRDPAMAQRYREALRQAREPADMLAVGRAMVSDIEATAGAERADGISERLARMLPDFLPEPSV